MALYKNKYRVESQRWQMWDYSKPASYFITICSPNRIHSFGKIVNQKMILSDVGKIVANEFALIPSYNSRIILDEWVIMPNHVHFVITLGDYSFDNLGGAGIERIHEFALPSPTVHQLDAKSYRKARRKMIIPKIIGKFKMKTSKKINLLRGAPQTPNWQADYHDHVIRNQRAYLNIINYIINNPIVWEQDCHNKKRNE
jgi:putative transposase